MSPPTQPIQSPEEELTPTHPDDPMTGEQADKLRALAERTDEEFDETLSQEQAAKRIAALKEIAETN